MSGPSDDASRALSRRDLLKTTALAGAALTLGGAFTPAIAEHITAGSRPDLAPPAPLGRRSMKGVPFERRDVVRIGIVGTGLRGRSVLHELLAIDGVRITAIAELVPEKALKAVAMITAAGQPVPVVMAGTDHAFESLVRRDDVDFVYTATPWEWHVPVLLAALRAGKHCGSECPIGTTLKDLWSLVDASEAAQRHCLQLENCCYGYSEMLANRLVHAGVLGEVKHAEAAYLHDLRDILFETRDEGLWRRAWHTRLNGNLYPTHGLGPVAWYMDIHRGDRFDYLVSMSTAERGLTNHRLEQVTDANDPRWSEQYITGDLNTSLVKTVGGKTILLQHDVSSPRPYSRLNNIQGTKGAYADYPPRLFVDGQAGGHRWASIDAFKQEYEHPLWTTIGEKARTLGGHDGMDYVMAYRLVQCIREGLVPDFDVYDAAAWSAPMPLSEISVAKGSTPVKFPDFTRDAWSKA